MRTFITSIACGAFLTLLPSPALTEIRSRTLEAGVYGGYNLFEGDQNLRNAPILGGRIGYNFTRYFSLEGGIESIRTRVDDRTISGQIVGQFKSPMDRIKLNMYYLDAAYHFNVDQNINPFIFAGLGTATYTSSFSSLEDIHVINIGAGLKSRITDNVSLRFDVKDSILYENFRDAYHNLGITGGLFVSFGGPARTDPEQSVSRYIYYEPLDRLRGPAGPAGPVGPSGPQGPIGYTGAPGYVAIGPRGPDGPSGPRGIRGQTGPTGATGSVEVGPAGVAGPSGPAGSRGERGWTGAQGFSLAGTAGPSGAAGPSGPRGARGAVGEQGPTLVGPSGPAGAQGPVGERGGIGATGVQGGTTLGVAGSAGVAGRAGRQGEIGPMGAQGPVGAIGRWVSYRDFWFASDDDRIQGEDVSKLREIAEYMSRNPSLQLGIDTFYDTRRNPNLRHRRINAVRFALIDAGVLPEKIRTGSIGNSRARNDARVEILLSTSQD